jgi:uncharacterized protein YndB with AHSA1/START domain
MRATIWTAVALAAGAALCGCAGSGAGDGAADRGHRDHAEGMIDTTRFDASGRTDREIVVEDVIAAPVSDVFDRWTSNDLLTAFETTGEIDLRIGGPFEVHFGQDLPEGDKGSEGCQILSYVPDRMVSYSWNSPPTIPGARERRSWAVVEFVPIGSNQTRVRLTHTGFGQGEAWDETHAYFVRAWPMFVGAVKASFGELKAGGIDRLAFMAGHWRGEAPGGGVVEAGWTGGLDGAMLGLFRWHTGTGSPLFYELLTISNEISGERTGVALDIRHFNPDLSIWDSEAGGPTRLVLAEVDDRRALFVRRDDTTGVDSIEYRLENDTLIGTVKQPGDDTPLVLRMTRVP